MAIYGNIVGYFAYYKHVRGEFEEAEKLYERAVEVGLNNIEKLGAYAVLIMRKGDFERSIEMLNKLIKSFPKKEFRIKIRINRAIANTKLKNYKEAKVALEDLHKTSRSKKVYQALGYLYLLIDDDNAEKYLLEAYDYDPVDDVFLDNLAQYYIQKDDYKKARIYAEEAYDVKPNGVDILHHLVLIEENDGNNAKAGEYAQNMMDAKLTPMNDVDKVELDKVYARVMGSGKEEIQ